jgi:hypothetical protein
VEALLHSDLKEEAGRWSHVAGHDESCSPLLLVEVNTAWHFMLVLEDGT